MSSEQCARPLCPGKTAAWLAYDYEARCAWLDDQPADEADRATRWPLCERHADLFKVPRGWFSVDRRAAPPVLAVTPDEAPAAVPRAGRPTKGRPPEAGTTGKLTAIL